MATNDPIALGGAARTTIKITITRDAEGINTAAAECGLSLERARGFCAILEQHLEGIDSNAYVAIGTLIRELDEASAWLDQIDEGGAQ